MLILSFVVFNCGKYLGRIFGMMMSHVLSELEGSISKHALALPLREKEKSVIRMY